MSIDTAPQVAGAESPDSARREAAIAAWLAGEDPPWLSRAALLHPEVEHPGACYRTRMLLAGLASVPVAVGADLSYAVGQVLGGHRFDALPLGPAWTIPAALAAAGLFALIALVWHALWHRAEAPFVFHVVHEEPDPARTWR
ncbi:hypothetical protein ACFFX1_10660 [Dactylosporangium sucinum]|uniref:Transmembrane protein n=1 Tax=Dactylosporangium sucinum TaxID=1424081 RepID=A0A917TH21_9ACTN|nr:hypothetical protein [Dactylosporangium sucinum]GGM23219.1 hypothetical protein GCM10007977_025520 [Dactylosporangium sucinum]